MRVRSNNGRILCQVILIPRGFIVVLTPEAKGLGQSLVNQGWMCHFWILLIIGFRPVVCWVGLSCVSKSTAISLNVATELLKYWLLLPRSSRASPSEDAININSNLRLRTAIQNEANYLTSSTDQRQTDAYFPHCVSVQAQNRCKQS